MKKVEAGCERTACTVFEVYYCGPSCSCIIFGILGGVCFPTSTAMKVVEDHPNLCQSHDDCIKKGSGSFCGYYPNSEIQHGRCFTSNVEAERYFEILTNDPAKYNFQQTISYSNGKEFLKNPVEIAT